MGTLGTQPGREIYKLNDMDILPPVSTLVTLDISAINWKACCFVSPVGTDPSILRWYSVPGWYHDNVGNISFADGHVERRKWTDPIIQQWKANTVVPNTVYPHNSSQSVGPDLPWLSAHSTVLQ